MPKGKWPSRSWILLLAAVILIRLSTLEPQLVERFYSTGIYPYLAAFLRKLTGWLPFSLGDIIYIAAAIWLIRELVNWIKAGRKKEISWAWIQLKTSNYIRIFLSIYIVFNLLWGLNYNRIGIASQLNLNIRDTSATGLISLTNQLLAKTNAYRPIEPEIGFQQSSKLAELAYDRLNRNHHYLDPKPHSLKPSIFGALGNYMGYSGYYNPFSGEGQINTSVPAFIIPFVSCHEMAHQIGYAKENEANFIGFLAARSSGDSAMLYSSYLNMFLYANGELRQIDSAAARKNMEALKPGVKKDLVEYRTWLKSYDTVIGDFVDLLYNQYLKLNEQPAGRRSYNQVVIWLLAWYNKYGEI